MMRLPAVSAAGWPKISIPHALLPTRILPDTRPGPGYRGIASNDSSRSRWVGCTGAGVPGQPGHKALQLLFITAGLPLGHIELKRRGMGHPQGIQICLNPSAHARLDGKDRGTSTTLNRSLRKLVGFIEDPGREGLCPGDDTKPRY